MINSSLFFTVSREPHKLIFLPCESSTFSEHFCQQQTLSEISILQIPGSLSSKSYPSDFKMSPLNKKEEAKRSPPMTLHAQLFFLFCLFYFVTEFLWLVPTSNSLTHPHFSLQADCLPRTPVQCRSFPMCSRDHTHHRQHYTLMCPYFLKPQLL